LAACRDAGDGCSGGKRMDDQDCVVTGPVVAVVALPAEIDIANAGEVRRDLTDAVASGAAVVIADMRGTTFSDTMGVRELVLAHKLADTKGAQFRVVVSSPNLPLSDRRFPGFAAVQGNWAPGADVPGLSTPDRRYSQPAFACDHRSGWIENSAVAGGRG
jgi:anti-anti-sigma factor